MSEAAASPPANDAAPLSVRQQLDGARLMIMGGTGFLGKVFLSLLLDRFPQIGHIWLVVRPKNGMSSEERFWSEIATSEAFNPIRERIKGAAWDAFLEDKITPVPGDITDDWCGIPQDLRDELRGTLTAFVNASGVVSFTPPLDYALNANAFGMKNLVALAGDLGGEAGPLQVLHTSTCYVAGDRTGQVDEVDPLDFPFPKAGDLDVKHWDPEREIDECVDMVDNVRHRASDAFRQSAFLDEAKKRLRERNEPTRGSALQAEFEKVKARYERRKLVAAGEERANYWGWHNVYTYTKSIGEQILRRSDVPHTIVRPAVIESAIEYPEVGWCEGINTSAPMIYLALHNSVKFPSAPQTVLDVIPVDQVAVAMLLALGELIEGSSPVIYQVGTSDTAPIRVSRLIELVALFKRRYYRNDAPGNPAFNLIQSRMEPVAASVEDYQRRGPGFASEQTGKLAKLVRRFDEGALRPVAGPIADGLSSLSKSYGIAQRIEDQFIPFMATHNYRFSCAHTRAAHARLIDQEKQLLNWHPEDMDWRWYMLEVHGPGLQRNVNPQIDEKMRREKRPLRAYDHLVQLMEQVADRHDLAPALLRMHPDGLERISYRQLRQGAQAVAARLLSAGLQRGDRVLLSGSNDPNWVMAFFGILRAGGVVVPLNPELEADQLPVILESSGAGLAILDPDAGEHLGDAVAGLTRLKLGEVAEGPADEPSEIDLPEVELSGQDLVAVLYTSGTTGQPKGVMLSNENLCSMIASLGALFPLEEDDRLLSVLPLHHAFELSCGMLLPLSMGARILYLDELSAERLTEALQAGRISAMVGVPALWQLLERRIRNQVDQRGLLFKLAFQGATELNRNVGRATGLDLGRLMFGSIHSRFGGNIRVLISGGAALPKPTQRLFGGLGLHLSEGYGLTEAAPVLAVSLPRPGARTGSVGKAIPGVELKIKDPDDKGVGEVLARGPNVMQGYFGNQDATTATLDEDGWLHTGDMGRLDHKGRLSLVGRAKDVVIAANGENIYLDDVEHRIGRVPYVSEFALCGVPDDRGGEKLGLLAVADLEGHADLSRRDIHDKAREALKEAMAELPGWQRPAVTHLVDADLPRNATRKVLRDEVAEVLDKISAAAPDRVRRGEGLAGPVGRAVAAVAGVKPGQVSQNTDLREAFGFDSLMYVELSAALEDVGSGRPDADALAECETVGDIIRLVGAPAPEQDQNADEGEQIELPEWLVEPLRKRMADVQRAFNGPGLDTRVYGRANIPHNRTCIVVSNHSSHLDMGLVKYALGSYGERIASLAAQDYFFEGNKWKVAWFRYFTNAEPLDRKSGFRTSMRQAQAVIESGKVVLIFPEGTRQTSGVLGEFKPMVGKLALDTGTDILPLWIDGAYEAMPKGAALPKKRGIDVHIGPPLEIAQLRRLTQGLRASKAARKVAALAREAVAALQGASVLLLDELEPEQVQAPTKKILSPAQRVEEAARSLSGRFEVERFEKPVTWYFSLGAKEGPRWTVQVEETGCTVRPGRPSGSADCVVKTSEDIFARMVQDAYVPEPSEFMSGAIKTNDIPLLIEFSRVFGLSEVEL